MKRLLILALWMPLNLWAIAFPPDISAGFAKSRVGESGGLSVHEVDPTQFIDYLCQHWREIADQIEQIPKAEGSFDSERDARNCAIHTFATACEWLPPEEYVDFLNKLTDLYEQKRMDYMPLEFQIVGSAKKEDFLGVNYSHPKVRALLKRLKPLVPESQVSWIEDFENGKFADTYLANQSDDAPLPETLPGVKLKRPFASMIPRFELLTGKKVPEDPRFPSEKRPENRAKTTSTTGNLNPGPIPQQGFFRHLDRLLIFSGACLVLLGIWLRLQRKSRAHSA